MAATVSWTEAAVGHIDDIAEYSALDSARNAAATVRRIVDSVASLARLPLQGRIVPEFGRD